MARFPWPAATATGIGSLPGTDMAEALRVVFGELPDLPHQPELPARGPGADMIGRAAALLVDLAVDLQPSGWRLVDRPGIDLRRSRDMAERDLDALLEVGGHYHGLFKIQVAGPWALAATVELNRGHKVVADPGATRDLAQSLAEGVAGYAGRVRARLPRCQLVVQWDEPLLPAVLSGQVPTPSGYGTVRAVEEQQVIGVLREVIDAVPDAIPVVHCCAPNAPLSLMRSAGAAAVAFDAGFMPADDLVGEAIEAGTGLWLGIVPSTDPGFRLEPKRLADRARELWRRLGFAADMLPRQVVVTPACGMAGATPPYARSALAAARDTARELAE
jgi:Cobalamin-independent synthase, Catalytic domain